MKRFICSTGVAAFLAFIFASQAWIAAPVDAASMTPAQQVNSDYNAVAKAGTTFESQFEAEVAKYGVTPEQTFAATLTEQAYRFTTPLEDEQEALLTVMLSTKLSAKARLASAVLAATITKFVYVLGLVGYASAGTTGIEGWATTFQSTKTLYQKEGKTALVDLGYSVSS